MMRSTYTSLLCQLVCGAALLGGSLLAAASVRADDSSEVEALREQVQSLQETVQQLQKTMLKMQDDTTASEERVQQQVEAVRKRQAEAFAAQLESPLDRAIQESQAAGRQPLLTAARPEGLWSRPLGGGAQLRLIDVAADVLFYAGGSSERDAALSTIQGGAHDPNRRGFTLGQAEISLAGAVDPYFRGDMILTTAIDPVEGETIVELEEAFLTTTSLPYNLQLEVGHFYTEFGLINPQHPHQWDWMDQPVINSRLFGGDGMRQTGLRASWIAPTPWFSELHFGMQNANGINMTSFRGDRHTHAGGGHAHEEEAGHEDEHGHEDDDMHEDDMASLGNGHEEDHDHGHEDEDMHEDELGHEDEDDHEDMHAEAAFVGDLIGGRPRGGKNVFKGFGDFVYLTRWNNSIDLTDDITGTFGLSGLYGPNATGDDADTWIYGLDMRWRWNPTGSFRGWPSLTWQTELMKRDFHADRFTGQTEDGDESSLYSRTLKDWGLYTQLLYGFKWGWAAGLRYEYAGGSGRSFGGRRNDPFRDNRHRFSPLLAWRPSEFSRIRLQYNFDDASHLDGSAHSVWLGFEWLYGAHPAHNF